MNADHLCLISHTGSNSLRRQARPMVFAVLCDTALFVLAAEARDVAEVASDLNHAPPGVILVTADH